jgi:hypothetical protein
MAIVEAKLKSVRHATSTDGEKLVYLQVFAPEWEANFDCRIPERALNGHQVGDTVDLEYHITTEVQVIQTRNGNSMGVVKPGLEFTGVAH